MEHNKTSFVKKKIAQSLPRTDCKMDCYGLLKTSNMPKNKQFIEFISIILVFLNNIILYNRAVDLTRKSN